MVLNPKIFSFEAHSVRASFLKVPDSAIEELYYMGHELFPDVLRWEGQMGYPRDQTLSELPLDVSESGSDSDDMSTEGHRDD